MMNITFGKHIGKSVELLASSRPLPLSSRILLSLSWQYGTQAAKNMIKGDDRSYEWTSFNKVKRLHTPQGLFKYAYDGNHSRVKKEHNGKTTYYFGRDYEVILDVDKQGRQVRRMRHHLFAGSELVATHEKTLIAHEKQADKTAYVHRDALGSVDTVTNEGKEIVQQQRFTPFGEDIAVIGSKKEYSKNDLRGFTSHENVGDTGLINMNARLYDPVIGRFIQADTVIPDPSKAMSYNRYVYVYNNPMKYVDPDGHNPLFLIGLGLFLFSMTTDDPFLQKVTALAGMLRLGRCRIYRYTKWGNVRLY
jgi:RHS repeat-associated protein